MPAIRFSAPTLSGAELRNVAAVLESGILSGNGPFTERCHAQLAGMLHADGVLLTQSCTDALEMAVLLAGIGSGDEVILPSFTFVSTANAVVLRGAVPVFVDIREDTLNLDEQLVEAAITPRTRAIMPVHYAGVACEMDALTDIARRRKLVVIEDAAQGFLATYRGRHLGAIGQLGALSFHETKNIVSGEGGALLVNDPALRERAEILWEKGTNRRQFFRGQIDKYTWMDIGSSFLPSEITAAILSAQLDTAADLTARRVRIWHRYHEALEPLERRGALRRPVIPEACSNNAHMYYVLLDSLKQRDAAIGFLRERSISAVFHYVPLHDSPAGMRFGRVHGDLSRTTNLSERLIRLPLFAHLRDEELARVIAALNDFFTAGGR